MRLPGEKVWVDNPAGNELGPRSKPVMKVPGPPPDPSAYQNRILARAETASPLLFTTE